MKTFRKLTLLLASLSLSAAELRADEIVLGLDNAFQADSNLFKTSTDEVRDGNYEISPSILFRRRGESKLVYKLLYQPSYDVYFVNENVNGVDHFFRATADYLPTRLGHAWVRANLTDYRSVRAADAPTDGIPDVIGGAPGRVNRFLLDAGYDHQLTRLTRVETALGFENYRFDTPNNVDSTGFGGDVALRKQIIPLVDVGVGVFASFRKYREQQTQPGSHNVVVEPNVVLTYEPIETLVFDFKVGPAWIRTEQSGGGDATVSLYRAATSPTSGETFGAVFDPACIGSSGAEEIDRCPIISAPALADFVGQTTTVGFQPGQRPADIDDSGVTAFATASVTKTESWGLIAAEYFRREDAAAGSGSTTVRDSVTGRIAFHPGWGLDVETRANWNRRKATSDVNRSIVEAGPSTIATGDGRFFAESVALIPNVVTDDFEIKQIWADVTIGRTVFIDPLRLEGRFRYLKQKRPDQPIVGTFQSYAGEIRLIYTFTAFEY
jgi:hypothetical protein